MKIIHILVAALCCAFLQAANAQTPGGSVNQIQTNNGSGGFGATAVTGDASGNLSSVNSISRNGTNCALASLSSCEFSNDLFPAPRGIGSEHDQDFTAIATYYGKGLSANGSSWRIQQLRNDTLTSYARGIHQGLTQRVNCFAVGDCAGIYSYVTCSMGSSNGNDEGCEHSLQVAESNGYYHGTITGGTSDSPTLSAATPSGTVLNDGSWLLDITQGNVIQGNLTGKAALSPTLTGQYALPVTITSTGGALPISSAIGVLTTAITGTQQMSGVGTGVAATLTLQTFNGGTPAFVASGASSGNVCFSGVPEQAPITITTTSPGSQDVVLKIRYNHVAGEVVYQGGICGQYLSFPDDLTLTGQRFSYPALGSTTGTDLLVNFPVRGGNLAAFLPRIGTTAETTSSAFTLYPGAEIVINNSTGIGPFLIEPHNLSFATNDTVEDPHHPAAQIRGLQLYNAMATPPNYNTYSNSLSINMSGPGISNAFRPIFALNSNSSTLYTEGGGKLFSPDLATVVGPFGYGFTFHEAPSGGLFYFTNAPFGSTNGQMQLFYWNYNGASMTMNNNTINGGVGELNLNRSQSAGTLCTPNCTSFKFMADQNGNVTAAQRIKSTFSTGPGFQEVLYTPASSSAACTAGQFTDDANYHYVCTATNTWKRVALSTF
jgi:hypothetical protein